MMQLSVLSPAYARSQSLNPMAAVKPSASGVTLTSAPSPDLGSTSTATKATGMTGTGSPLSSQTLSGALSVQEGPLATTVDLDDPNNEIFKTITPGDAKSLRLPITPDDARLIREVTGVNLRVVNNLIMPFDDNGNLAPGPAAWQAQNLAAQIGIDRHVGNLTGEIDADYVKGLIAQSKQAGTPLPMDLQDKLMAAVAKRDSAEKAA